MRIPRIHTEKTLINGESLVLENRASRHLLRALRMKPGDQIAVFNGDGSERRAEIANIDNHQAVIHVLETIERASESPLAVTLNQAVGRGERMDYSIQKAVELGVARIRPTFTERTVVNLSGDRLEKRLQHWRGVIAAACEQCGRTRLPELLAPAKTVELARPSDRLRLVLDPDAQQRLADLEPPESGLELLIGPEGGLSGDELSGLVSSGWQAVTLGPRILRTETAGVAAMAVMQSLWGDL